MGRRGNATANKGGLSVSPPPFDHALFPLVHPQVFPSKPLDLGELKNAFEKAVIKRLMSDVPFGRCGCGYSKV